MVNNSMGSTHQHEMSVEGQLQALRGKERTNLVSEVAIQALCACVAVAALAGPGAATAGAALVLVGLIVARRRRMPSLEDLADRLDRHQHTQGLVRTALASEGGLANGSPLLVAHAIAQADSLLRSRGRAIVRPFRFPRWSVAAALLAFLPTLFVAARAPTTVDAVRHAFAATGFHADRAAALPQDDDQRTEARRSGAGLGSTSRFGATGGGATTGIEGAIGEVAGSKALPEPAGPEEAAAEPDPCPPDVLCVPKGRGSDRTSLDGGSGVNGLGAAQGAAEPRSEPRRGDHERADPDLGMNFGTSSARGSPQGGGSKSDKGDGERGEGPGDDGQREQAPDVRLAPDHEQDASNQHGGVNGAGGTDDGVAELSQLEQVALAEEHVEGLWQASAEGTIDAIEDGLAGERTTVPWRDLHAWYEAIAEDAVTRESVPVARRAYVRQYFDAIAPRAEGQ
jgi:hypothetical protein